MPCTALPWTVLVNSSPVCCLFSQSGRKWLLSVSWTHHADNQSLLQRPGQLPNRWVMGKRLKRVRRTLSKVGMMTVGTGSSGWGQLTGGFVMEPGLNWNCYCCACCPSHFLWETLPSPCTEAERGPRRQAGCDPITEAPRTGWNFHHCHLLHSHYCCYCQLSHFHSSWCAMNPHPNPLICLQKETNKTFL